jgi:hypothetical protein
LYGGILPTSDLPIEKKPPTVDKALNPMAVANSQAGSKNHHTFLVKEMIWMAEDFDRERKKRIADLKRNARTVKKSIDERSKTKER